MGSLHTSQRGEEVYILKKMGTQTQDQAECGGMTIVRV